MVFFHHVEQSLSQSPLMESLQCDVLLLLLLLLVVVIETNNPDSSILKKHLLVRKMRQIIR